jgi:hypothetical protein
MDLRCSGHGVKSKESSIDDGEVAGGSREDESWIEEYNMVSDKGIDNRA